jgi:hypothetical protein
MQLCKIENSIFDATVIAIPEQVVLLVGIERPLQNCSNYGLAVTLI